MPKKLQIQENVPLKPLTTFKIGGPARLFAEVASAEDVCEAVDFARAKRAPVFVIGGGSNMLVSDAGLEALVIHPVNQGITADAEKGDAVRVRVGAGEPWDRLVEYAVGNDWRGIENLSHIPGSAGAAAVQNIGAYGQQLSDALESVEAAELKSGAIHTFTAAECGLGYRRSIFNSSHRGSYVIFSLTLKLSRAAAPQLGYPDVKAWFEARGAASPSLAEIRSAIIAIRDSKFPFPRTEVGGNAGSFFKNVALNEEQYQALERRVAKNFDGAAVERLREARHRFRGNPRIPTALLISLCGLKGARVGGAIVSERQPLVLLNMGGASAADVLSLVRLVRATVRQRTGILIDVEPELVGFKESELAAYLTVNDGAD